MDGRMKDWVTGGGESGSIKNLLNLNRNAIQLHI
jgi:hypothetical protein